MGMVRVMVSVRLRLSAFKLRVRVIGMVARVKMVGGVIILCYEKKG